jgi:hypothetical protein
MPAGDGVKWPVKPLSLSVLRGLGINIVRLQLPNRGGVDLCGADLPSASPHFKNEGAIAATDIQ